MGPQDQARRLIARLNRSSRFTAEDHQVQEGETKLGDGLEQIILTGRSKLPVNEQAASPTQAGVRSYVDGPVNPGFRFSAEGSELRPGPSLEMGQHFTKLRFAGQQLNPMAEFVPSSAAFPVTTIISVPPIQDLVGFLKL